jgi:hypothetical protein
MMLVRLNKVESVEGGEEAFLARAGTDSLMWALAATAEEAVEKLRTKYNLGPGEFEVYEERGEVHRFSTEFIRQEVAE